MSDKDLTKKDLQKIKDLSFLDKETSPEVEKKIDLIIEKLDKELAKNKEIIAEVDKVLLDRLSYEDIQQLANSVRLRLGFDLLR